MPAPRPACSPGPAQSAVRPEIHNVARWTVDGFVPADDVERLERVAVSLRECEHLEEIWQIGLGNRDQFVEAAHGNRQRSAMKGPSVPGSVQAMAAFGHSIA